MPDQRTSSAARLLLTCGIIAGPFYILVGLLQVLFREGFDPTRHPLSLMSLGPLGWIQIANFIITGSLVVAFALGIRQTIRAGRGRIWAPILIGFYGLSLIAAGIFIADPMDGFPPGTPPGPPESPSPIGALHFMAGGLGFLAFLAATIVFARRFVASSEWPLAAFTLATGILFLLSFISIATSGGAPWATIAFTFGVILSWVWMSTIALHLLQRAPSARAFTS